MTAIDLLVWSILNRGMDSNPSHIKEVNCAIVASDNVTLPISGAAASLAR